MLFPEQAQMAQMADELAEHGLLIREQFTDDQLTDALIQLILEYQQQDALRPAGIGAGGDFQLKRSIRGDFIKWIVPPPEEEPLKNWFALIDQLREGFNRELFLGLRDQELHMAVYPVGTYYKRHLDQFQDRNNRQLSVILYLNKHWKPGDGGELVIYRDGLDPLVIAPKAGTFVCFRSELLEHEVLPTHAERLSITGWLLKKPVGLGFLG